MFYVYATLLALLNLACLSLTLAGLPGIWLMIGLSLLVAWLTPQSSRIGFEWPTLVTVLVIAAIAEIVELLAGATGSKKSGGSHWGAIGALFGGMAGAILGTFLIPVPVIGTIAGAVGGAFAGAVILELASGKPHGVALRSGKGAAIGHFIGIMTKFSLGCLVWLILAIAAFRA